MKKNKTFKTYKTPKIDLKTDNGLHGFHRLKNKTFKTNKTLAKIKKPIIIIRFKKVLRKICFI